MRNASFCSSDLGRCVILSVLGSTLLMLAGCVQKTTSVPAGTTSSSSTSSSSASSSTSTSGQKPIHVVAFDEHDETLQAIIDGEIYGTVVQNPYMYGYKSIEILKKMADGEDVLQGKDFIDMPARMITRETAADFWKDKKQKLKDGEGEYTASPGRESIAYVTNGIDPFWTVAAAGAVAAGKEFDVNVLLRFPAKGVGDQKSILESLMVQEDVTGIAVSPIDPENQQDLLNQVGSAKNFVTHDSDAPNTNRKAYIGMSNYDAGRMAGQLVKKAMPEGGSVMIFVGRLGQLNAEQRRQGVIDELLDRSLDPTRRDDPQQVIKGEKYTVLGTQTDNFEKANAKQNAQDAISKYPDLGCMVGLFAYNPPLCLQAVREAGRVAQVP